MGNLDKYKKTLTDFILPPTLTFSVKGNKVLLGYKKTGFGKGKYLGIGGKVEKGESKEIRPFWVDKDKLLGR